MRLHGHRRIGLLDHGYRYAKHFRTVFFNWTAAPGNFIIGVLGSYLRSLGVFNEIGVSFFGTGW